MLSWTFAKYFDNKKMLERFTDVTHTSETSHWATWQEASPANGRLGWQAVTLGAVTDLSSVSVGHSFPGLRIVVQ